MSARILAGRGVLVDATTWLDGGGLLVHRGRVLRLLESRAAVRRAARSASLHDTGGLVLTAGLVNAHAHLELSGLVGRLPRGGDFGAWVRRLLELRSQRTPRDLAEDARRGAQRCLQSGTTLVGDLDTLGGGEHGLPGAPLRVVLFRELLDAYDPTRTAPALSRVRRALPRRARLREGLAPHAPYSASPELLAAIARLARKRGAPVSVHWSETEAEELWLRQGRGPFGSFLARSPRVGGLDLLEQAGLLGPSLVLVHGNLPARGEPARIAAAGATLVHCPGSHAWFGHPGFPLDRYRRAGVRIALGTDSLASNEDLDLAREMALLRAGQPGLAADEAWAMGTTAGAHALGHAGRSGTLAPGAHADVVGWLGAGTSRTTVLEQLTNGAATVARTWLSGRSRDVVAE